MASISRQGAKDWGELKICTENALHGTFEPHRWKGVRVWVAGFLGEIQRKENKVGSLHREIIGEVFPETCLSESVGVRIGMTNLEGADLRGANLRGANLWGADLRGAKSTCSLPGWKLEGDMLVRQG